MRVPTEAEIDAIPVTDEEVEQHVAKLNQIGHALNKAGIPATRDWVVTLLAVAAQALVLDGMPKDYFMRVARVCFQSNEGQPRRGLEARDVNFGEMQQSVMRIIVALRRVRITLNSEVAVLLLDHAAEQLYDGGVEEEAFLATSSTAYDQAEERLRATAKRKGSA